MVDRTDSQHGSPLNFVKMKILTPRNNKDYYDYLTGIYGEDEKIVYDRRVFTVLTNLDSPLFSYVSTPNDSPKKEVRRS